MADELMFPPSDALSLIDDFEENLLPNNTLINTLNPSIGNDLNPSYLQSELLNIPPLVPSVISPTGGQKHTVSPSLDMQQHQYTPINQLMKQTEQLPQTLGSQLPNQDALSFHSLDNQQVVNNNAISFSQVNNSSSQCIVVGGQRIQMAPQNSIQNNMLSLQQQRQQQQQTLIQQQLLHQQQQLRLQQHHQQQKLNVPISTKPINSLLTNNLSMISSTHATDTQTDSLSLPQLQQNKNTKAPLKGQIVKTSEQRLMFVTELNGKRVAYYIQQSSSSAASVTQTSPFSSTPAINEPLVSSINIKNKIPDNQVDGISKLSNVITIDSSTLNFDNDSSSVPQHFNDISKVEELNKKDQFTKSLRDKLLSLCNNSSLMKTNDVITTYSQMQNSVEESLNDKRSSPVKLLSPLTNKRTDEVMENKDRNEEEEEDGQEIEFSENDLSFNLNESNDSLSPSFNNLNHDTAGLLNDLSTDDEESVPLSVLKAEAADDLTTNANQIIEEELGIDSVSKRSMQEKKAKSSDTLPLSVVAASLKKNEDAPKKRSKTKGKKKKKDKREPSRPLFAYQVFFRDVQGTLREKNPQLTFGELSKLIAQMWEKLEEEKKTIYQGEYQKAKAEYEIKMVEFKELLAMEESSNALSPTEPVPSAVVEITCNKKKTNRITKKSMKKEIHPDNQETEYTKEKKFIVDQLNELNPITSSPSLPSSDSSSDESDREDTIIQMKRRAAELKKKIKIEKKAVNKIKLAKEAKKANRVTRMEVETISETETLLIELETGSPQKQVVPTKSSHHKQFESTLLEQSQQTQIKNSTQNLYSKLTTQVPSLDLLVSPIVEDNSSPPPTKVKKIESPVSSDNIIPVSKTSFKIPKKSGSNITIPLGPRMCVRLACNNPAKTSRERGAQYCSNDCLVIYCRDVFESWVSDRQNEDVDKT